MHGAAARSIPKASGQNLGPAGRACNICMDDIDGASQRTRGDSGEQKGAEFGVILFYQLRWLEWPAWPDCPAGKKSIGISRSGSKLNLLAACRLSCSLIAARSADSDSPGSGHVRVVLKFGDV